MNTINYLFDNFSFWELAVYALMYGIAITFLVGAIITLFRFIKEIVQDYKFIKE